MSGQSAEREAAVRAVAEHGWSVARETARGYYVMRLYLWAAPDDDAQDTPAK